MLTLSEFIVRVFFFTPSIYQLFLSCGIRKAELMSSTYIGVK